MLTLFITAVCSIYTVLYGVLRVKEPKLQDLLSVIAKLLCTLLKLNFSALLELSINCQAKLII